MSRTTTTWISVDRSRCVLCDGPNDCALARHEASGGVDPDSAGMQAEPCWCVGREFPESLVQRATRQDGGESCICLACLEKAREDESRGGPANGR